MRVLAKIYLVLSVLSLITGFLYLAVAYSQDHESLGSFSPISGFVQIFIAAVTLAITTIYLRGNEKVEVAAKACYVIFAAFLTYTIYF